MGTGMSDVTSTMVDQLVSKQYENKEKKKPEEKKK